ncbi:hypothetical protein TRIP_E190040 [uncultured Spirochaetota bacterium]|uniref:Uncharacterized protein n=1 Tax=uncultured Spirochaetota bacterium TaxID=460511 RepID=A0A652ZTM3_9SPIR|nr:hypothetical protein TRIP_E190040 [uncultured Spirochaetota bacterium]
MSLPDRVWLGISRFAITKLTEIKELSILRFASKCYKISLTEDILSLELL